MLLKSQHSKSRVCFLVLLSFNILFTVGEIKEPSDYFKLSLATLPRPLNYCLSQKCPFLCFVMSL